MQQRNIDKDCRVFWRYFYCAFLGFCFGIFDSNVQPEVGKFGCNWLEWFARGQGIWLQIFEKCQIPTSLTLIGALLKWGDVDFNQSEKGIKSKIDILLILTNHYFHAQNHSEQAAFWHELKSCVSYTIKFFTRNSREEN